MKSIPRDTRALPCNKCKGFMEEVTCTQEEINNQWCGRTERACCVRAFKCIVCSNRVVCRLDAPDME